MDRKESNQTMLNIENEVGFFLSSPYIRCVIKKYFLTKTFVVGTIRTVLMRSFFWASKANA